MKNTSTLAALTLLLAVFGCKLPGVLSKSGEPANSNSGRTADTPSSSGTDAVSPTGDAFGDLKASFKRVSEAKAFQAVINSTGGERDFHVQVGYAAPNRYRINNGVMETIIIGNDTYSNLNGAWRKLPMSIGPVIQNLRDLWADETLRSISDVQFAGGDTVNGKASLVYTYKCAAHNGVNPYAAKVWIGGDNGLPQKYELAYTNGSQKRLSTSYEYNDVPIDPPIKN